jgi:predicted RNase H-like HicB family nuclease
MALRYDPAPITQDDGVGEDAGYGVVFPDLPGCVSGGDTVRQAAEGETRAGFLERAARERVERVRAA